MQLFAIETYSSTYSPNRFAYFLKINLSKYYTTILVRKDHLSDTLAKLV